MTTMSTAEVLLNLKGLTRTEIGKRTGTEKKTEIEKKTETEKKIVTATKIATKTETDTRKANARGENMIQKIHPSFYIAREWHLPAQYHGSYLLSIMVPVAWSTLDRNIF